MEQLLSLLGTAVKSKTASDIPLQDLKDIESDEKFVSVLEDAFVSLELDAKDAKNLNAKMFLLGQSEKSLLTTERDVKELKDLKNSKDIKELLKLSDEKGLNLKSLIVEIKKASESKKIVIEKDETKPKEAAATNRHSTAEKIAAVVKEQPNVKKEAKIDLKELIAGNTQHKDKKSDTALLKKSVTPKGGSEEAPAKEGKTSPKEIEPAKNSVAPKAQEKPLEQKNQTPLPTKMQLAKESIIEHKPAQKTEPLAKEEKTETEEIRPAKEAKDIKAEVKQVEQKNTTTPLPKEPQQAKESVKTEKPINIKNPEPLPEESPAQKTEPWKNRVLEKEPLAKEAKTETKEIRPAKEAKDIKAEVKPVEQKNTTTPLPKEPQQAKESVNAEKPVNIKNPEPLPEERPAQKTEPHKNSVLEKEPLQQADLIKETKKAPLQKSKKNEQVQESQMTRQERDTKPAENNSLSKEPPKSLATEKNEKQAEPKNQIEPEASYEKAPKKDLASILMAKERIQAKEPAASEKKLQNAPIEKTDTKLFPEEESQPEKKVQTTKEPEIKKTDAPMPKQNHTLPVSIVKKPAGKTEPVAVSQHSIQKLQQEIPLAAKESASQPQEQIKTNLSLNTLLVSKSAEGKNIKKSANEPIAKNQTLPQASFANTVLAENTFVSDKTLFSQILSTSVSAAVSQVVSADSSAADEISFKAMTSGNSNESQMNIETGSDESSNELLKSDDAKVQNLRSKIVTAKSTLNHFSGALKEQIESYKAPIMKISMELNPKNLGSVEVTLLNRGKNLHVKINSNTQAINMFTQNSIDFKNSLNDLGYKDVELNFSSGSDQRDGTGDKERENRQQEFINRYKEEEPTTVDDELEIIIPNLIYG